MKVLMMGGTRFVGRPLVSLLKAAGHELTLFTRGRNPCLLYTSDAADE